PGYSRWRRHPRGHRSGTHPERGGTDLEPTPPSRMQPDHGEQQRAGRERERHQHDGKANLTRLEGAKRRLGGERVESERETATHLGDEVQRPGAEGDRERDDGGRGGSVSERRGGDGERAEEA